MLTLNMSTGNKSKKLVKKTLKVLTCSLGVLLILATISRFGEHFGKITEKLTKISLTNGHPTHNEDNSTKEEKNVDTEHILAERMARIEEICHNHTVPGEVLQLIAYAPTGVAYCSAHKVASSYWLQVFRYLFHDTPKPVKRPQDITKYDTHLAKYRSTKFLNFRTIASQKQIEQYFRFMMTRDPYKRLWSVYIDKFVIVDNYFWRTFSPEIRRVYLRSHGNTSVIKTGRCLNISFEEFLHYVSIVGSEDPRMLDEHMKPVHIACNPCLYKPHFVGKVETMTVEKDQVLQKLNISDNITSFEEHVENEIRFVSEFQFVLTLSLKLQSSCVTNVDVEKKLLHAFVLNGYLRPEDVEELSPLLPLSRNEFTSEVIKIFRASHISAKYSSAQRRRYLTEAYSKIPNETLAKLQNIYKYDFMLFDYEQRPDYIYT